MLFECWVSVVDGGPTFKQHWLSASCFLGPDLDVSIYGLSSAHYRQDRVAQPQEGCTFSMFRGHFNLNNYILSQILSHYATNNISFSRKKRQVKVLSGHFQKGCLHTIYYGSHSIYDYLAGNVTLIETHIVMTHHSRHINPTSKIITPMMTARPAMIPTDTPRTEIFLCDS